MSIEYKKNAPSGVFDPDVLDHPYAGYESLTYDWKVVYEDGDLVMYECFDGVDWERCYCACYKGKAYAYGDYFGTIRNIHDAACLLLKTMKQLDKN